MTIDNRFKDKDLILASQSPRRQYLMKELGLNFRVMTPEVDENYPGFLTPVEIATYLADLKSDSFSSSLLSPGTILITADTIVSIRGEILGKPENYLDAISMLQKLSGHKHDVITAVCLRSANRRKTFHVISSVYFKELKMEEINYYIENFHPFDKAGSYGVQEWIGYIGITKIEGSYFNVMGLPVKELYEELLQF